MNAVAAIALSASLLTATPEEQVQRTHAQLAKSGVDLKTDALLAVLRRRILSEPDRAEIAAVIARLRSDSFRQREEAMVTLIDAGRKCATLIDAARKAADEPELQARLEHIAEQVGRDRDDGLIWSALIELRRARPPRAADLLLKLLPELPSRRLWAPAHEALWACAAEQHLPLLREALLDGRPIQKAAALCALEKLTADPQPALKLRDHDSAVVRLAAARVLSAHQPAVAAEMLLELRWQADRGVQAEAEYLLRLLHLTTDKRGPPLRSTPDQWRLWVQQRGGQLAKLGPRRHRCGVVQLGVHEDFALDAAAVTNGYGPFFYESTVASKASIRDGRLYLDGNHAEGDQRLAISAEQLASTAVLREPLVIESKIGGLPGNEIGWHVGLSIGNVKALFHPGYAGGAFRVETVDKHQYLIANRTMPFTPATGKLHSMRMDVTPQADGGAKIQIYVKDATSGRTFEAGLTATKQQLGPLNRVGLERSGRAGGAAMFDDLNITLK